MHSIIQNSKRCFITGATHVPLHKHHCVNGHGLRSFAEKEGLYVYLSWNIHSDLHTKNSSLKKDLTRIAQFYYELNHTRKEWMSHVHKNYLASPLTEKEFAKYKINPFAEEYDISKDPIKFNEVKV